MSDFVNAIERIANYNQKTRGVIMVTLEDVLEEKLQCIYSKIRFSGVY